MNLQQIIEGCKKGDRACQKVLYSLHFNQFMSICLRYLPIKADAEEVLNNSFLRIFKHINQYKNEGSFEGWMKRIVVNCCLAFIRTASYENRTKIISLQHQSYSFKGNDYLHLTSSSNKLDEKFNKDYLYNILMQLPENTRLVFNLYVFEDYNHKEIGEALNMAERTSQAHLAKARKILGEEIDKKKLVRKIQRV